MRAVLFASLLAVITAPSAAFAELFPAAGWDAPIAGTITYVEPSGADSFQTATVEQVATKETAAIEAAATGPGYGDVACCRGIYFQGDGLYWGRVGTGCNQILAVNSSLPGSGAVLQTNDLNFNGTGGMRFLVGWRPDPCRCSRCCAWELSYFGLINWQANAQVQGAGNLAIPGDLGLASNNFFGADVIDVNYRSSLHNIELNCVKTCCLCDATLDFLCGFRFLTLQERFVITGTDLQEGTSTYNVKANNYLYGVQLGGRYTRHYDLWSVQLTGKGGVFLNDASQSQFVTDFPNVGGPFVLRDPIRGDGSAVAALGEVGITAIRPINDTWSLRLGYMALGIGGVALAPDQLDFTDTLRSGASLQSTGWIFVHGAVLGAEAKW